MTNLWKIGKKKIILSDYQLKFSKEVDFEGKIATQLQFANIVNIVDFKVAFWFLQDLSFQSLNYNFNITCKC